MGRSWRTTGLVFFNFSLTFHKCHPMEHLVLAGQYDDKRANGGHVVQFMTNIQEKLLPSLFLWTTVCVIKSQMESDSLLL